MSLQVTVAEPPMLGDGGHHQDVSSGLCLLHRLKLHYPLQFLKKKHVLKRNPVKKNPYATKYKPRHDTKEQLALQPEHIL